MPADSTDGAGWNHANPILEVSDVQRAIAFYRDVLGLVPTWTWEDRIAGVTTSEAPIEIYLSRSEQPTPSRLAVFVDDADATYERYRARGAEIVSELETAPWGLRGFTLRDPDGNLIDVAHEVGSPVGQPEYRQLA